MFSNRDLPLISKNRRIEDYPSDISEEDCETVPVECTYKLLLLK